MGRVPAASRPARSPYISRFQPGDDLPASAQNLVRLGEPDGVEEQADDRPPGHELQSEVRAPEQQAGDEDHHVRIAPGGDEPELAVDALPDVDVHAAEALDEDALDDALRDIAADD